MNEVVPWLMDECRVRELWLPNHPVVRALLEEARKESWPANLGDRLVRACVRPIDRSSWPATQ